MSYETVDGHRIRTAPADAPSRPETPLTLAPDQQGGTGASLRELLHTPGVHLAPDEMRNAVVIVLPVDVALTLTDLCPDPLQALLACQLVTDPGPDPDPEPHRWAGPRR